MLQDWADKVVRSGRNRLAPDLVSYGRGLRPVTVEEGREMTQLARCDPGRFGCCRAACLKTGRCRILRGLLVVSGSFSF